MVASLLPTSGTGGAPKLVQLTHRNYVTSAERPAANGGQLGSDRHYLCSSFFHTNVQLYLCAPPLISGGSIAIVPRSSATQWFDAVRWVGATVASMVLGPYVRPASTSGLRPPARQAPDLPSLTCRNE
jgi:crotonobetaine/carnitine-CoA ligase